jgi:phosphatidylserine decarboxylase
MLHRLFAYSQYLLPKYWMTAAVYRLARIRVRAVKDALIRGFLKLYDVRVDEVRGRIPGDFATFNDFFIRDRSRPEHDRGAGRRHAEPGRHAAG